MNVEEYKRYAGESYEDYFVRLGENQSTYHLTWNQIAELLNAENHANFGESAYRKRYKAFNEGRIYQRNLNESGVVTRILSISDLHVPYQLPVETFSKYTGRVDILQMNGDVVDMQAISKFPKAYRDSPMEELITGRQYLIDLIEMLQPKQVIVTYGNHDLRFQDYLSRNLDSDLLELMPATALELILEDGFRHYDKRSRSKIWYEPLNKIFKDVDIQYTGKWYCQIGDSVFCHPSAYSSGILKTAEKALYWFRNEGYNFKTLVMAHTHRIGNYIIGNSTIYEQGCCCDITKIKYADGRLVNSQKQGCLYLGQDKNGNTIKCEQEKIN